MENCANHLAHEERLKNLESQIAELTRQKERLAIVEQNSKSAHHRLDAIQEQTAAIIKISISIENLALQVKDILVQYKDHDNRIDKLERAPGDNALSFWRKFLGALAAGIGGLVLGFIVKGK